MIDFYRKFECTSVVIAYLVENILIYKRGIHWCNLGVGVYAEVYDCITGREGQSIKGREERGCVNGNGFYHRVWDIGRSRSSSKIPVFYCWSDVVILIKLIVNLLVSII